jgi:hypothetical protein
MLVASETCLEKPGIFRCITVVIAYLVIGAFATIMNVWAMRHR